MGKEIKAADLYPIADALYMPIEMHSSGIYSGSRIIDLEYSGLSNSENMPVLPFEMTIVKTFKDTNNLGIGFWIKCTGRIRLYVYYEYISDTIYVALANPLIENDVRGSGTRDLKNFKNSLKVLKIETKKIWFREEQATEWSSL